MNTKILIFRGGLIQFKRVLLAQFTKKRGLLLKNGIFSTRIRGGGLGKHKNFISFLFFGASPNSLKLISNKSKLRVFFKMG